MINLLEEKLNSIEKKELIYIFLSIPIVVFIIYYNFIYPKLETENTKLLKTLQTKKKALIKVSKQIRIVKSSKIALIPTRKKLEILKEDFKFLKYNFDTLKLIKLNNKRIYIILTKLLNKAKEFNLETSFKINWNDKVNKPFNKSLQLEILGKGDYVNFVKFIQFIDYLDSLVYIESFNISKSNKENLIKKPELGTLSFTLTEYKKDTLRIFKEFAKNNKLDLSIVPNKLNSNYLNIKFAGDAAPIKKIRDFIYNNVILATRPLFKITDYTFNLPKNIEKSENKQYFTIKIKLVGVK